jgi:hypothetical protein
MNARGGEYMGADRLDQRHQRRRRRADPVSKRRHVELEALAGIDLALAVERQMQAILAEQDVCQKARSGTAARDRMQRREQLGDRSRDRHENFSRTCWITFHWRGINSNVSVMSSPSLCSTPPQYGHADGDG